MVLGDLSSQTRDILISKNQFEFLESNNRLIEDAFIYTFTRPGSKETLKFNFKDVTITYNQKNEFKYFISKKPDVKRKAFLKDITDNQKNARFTIKASVDVNSSELNDTLKFLTKNSSEFQFSYVVLGERNVFVAEPINELAFQEMIAERTFLDKALRIFFGKNVLKLNYDLVFDNINVCFVKDIIKGTCEEEMLFDTVSKTYKKFANTITDASMAGGYAKFVMALNEKSSKINDRIKGAIIKDMEGKPFVKFYFCIPKVNTKPSIDKFFDIEAKLVDGNNQPIKNIPVLLMDEKGEVVNFQYTNKDGDFIFRGLQSGKAYKLFIEKDNKAVPVKLQTRKGEFVAKFDEKKDGFDYLLVESDMIKLKRMNEDNPTPEFRTSVKGKIVKVTDKLYPLSNIQVQLTDSNDNVILDKKTDKDGAFEFDEIDPTGNYSIKLPDYVAKKDDEKIYLANLKNQLLSRIFKGKKKLFEYKLLPTDLYYMSKMEEEDVKMSFQSQIKSNTKEVVIKENIYFDFNSYQLKEEAFTVLDKILNLLKKYPEYKLQIISHTDSRGDNNDNLKLSQKRSESVFNYLVNKGISKSNLLATGKGESELLNSCGDNVSCTEDEHKMNRRTEFLFRRD